MTEVSNGRPIVVVGVSARSKSPTALRWAAELASLRGAELIAVRAWRAPAEQPGSRGTPAQMQADRTKGRKAAEDRLRADVEAVLGEQHAARVLLREGTRVRVLLTASQDAEMLVVDAPRPLEPGAGPGLVHRLLANLGCPLVVVPRAIAGYPPSRVGRAARKVGRSVTEAAGRSPRPGMGHVKPT